MLIGFPLMGIFGLAIPQLSGLLAKGLVSLGVANWIISLICGAVMTAVTFALMMVSYAFCVSLVFGFYGRCRIYDTIFFPHL